MFSIQEISRNNSNTRKLQAGFTLIELMMVVAIMGILCGYVIYNLTSNATELKTYVFNTKSQLHRAKFEAIKRKFNVFVDFDFDNDTNIDNGYTIWVDENNNGAYNVGVDTILENIVFQEGPVIYNTPRTEEPGLSDNGPGAARPIGDGVFVTNNKIIFEPDGDSTSGAFYLYFPKSTTDNTLVAGPWAIITNSVGRIRIDEWKSTGWVTDT